MATVTWDKAKETVDAYKSGGTFIRLQDDGAKFVGAFVGEPCVRELYFDEKTKTYEKFSPKHRDEGKKPSAKFSINVYVPAKKGEKPEPRACRVFEMNSITFKDLLKVKDKYGLERYMFEVSREGAKGSPKTTYHILPEDKLTEEQLGEIKLLLAGTEEGFKLHDLEEIGQDDDDSGGGKADLSSADDKKKAAAAPKDKPKDAPAPAAAAGTNGHANGTNGATGGAPSGDVLPSEKAAELMARLKVRPNEEILGFLKEFGVKKIKEVPLRDAARAFAYVDKLEGKGQVAEDDPFA